LDDAKRMTEPDVPHLLYSDRPVLKPTLGAYLRHLLLLVLTFCTATVAGSLFPFGPNDAGLPDADPQTFDELIQFLASAPTRYAVVIITAVHDLFTHPGYLAYGLKFSLSLLFILFCHEMGHYVACRIYRVDATLPFFIPTPPMVGPAGTFGAFIKILSPMPSRRAVFDIGVAGPIAGFIALIPIAIVGVATMEVVTRAEMDARSGGLSFADPLFMKALGAFFGKDLSLGFGNPFYFAGWIGLLVTALNLIPSGQLDGGHAMYAVLGEKIHYWTGRVAFVAMAALSILGLYFFNSPSGFLIAVILGVMMKIRHPRPWDITPLDGKRKFIAFLTLMIFVLCFVPFPIRIS
jgi:membrane-associated protease RseP (regulator of RpoE activity)